MRRDRIVGMAEEYTIHCLAVTARISRGTYGWNILVRLLNLERSHGGISDLDAAKTLAIEYARELCLNNMVPEPECLNFPVWIKTETH